MTRKLRSLIAVLLCAAMSLSLLASCGGGGGTAEETSAPASGTASGGESGLAADQTLNLLMSGTINTLDPTGNSWTGELQVCSQAFSSLLRIVSDEAGNDSYVCDGAESFTISDDGLVYTFTLRDNYWSDGEAVTAQQYVDSFMRNLDPQNGFSTTEYMDVVNAEAYYNGECEASDVGVKALDDKTVEYTLEHANTNFLYYLAYRSGYPARMDVIEAATSQYGTDVNEMVFNGPFKVTSWVKENSITLEKNEYYWDAENVALETVKLQYVAEQSTQATLFDAQQLDAVPYNDDYGADWEAQAEAGAIQYADRTGAYVYFLDFAIENGGNSGLMSNEKIRKALSLAVDREELVSTVWGRYEAAYTFVPPACSVGETVYNVSGEGLVKEQQAEYSTDEALQALFQEGLTELGRSTDLSMVTIDFVTEAANVASQTQTEYIAQTWERRLGINVNVDITTDQEERTIQMTYDVSFGGWEGGASPYDYLWIVNVPFELKYLTGVYTNEHVNELLSTVTAISDEEEQASVYHEIENTILEEAGVAPLYFSDIKYFVQNYVDGLYFTCFGPEIDFSHARILAH